MNLNIEALRCMVKHILVRREDFRWSLQGFGMLRLHLPGDARIHVWDDRFAVPGVSTIHDHLQWGLESTVVSGLLTNVIYRATPVLLGGDTHLGVVLKPGVGTMMKSEPKRYMLREESMQVLMPGETYTQAPAVIHESRPERGTVTFMQKHPTNDESARVFWPRGTEWVSAEPRPALDIERDEIIRNALQAWAQQDEELARVA